VDFENSFTSDLHTLAADIGSRYSLDLDKIRLALLQKWLVQDIETLKNKNDMLLASTRFQLAISKELDGEKSLQKRISFLLSSKQFEESKIEILLSFAYQQSSKIQTMTRVRALSVLFTTTDSSTLKSRGANPEELK
jgi:hypothetical protein